MQSINITSKGADVEDVQQRLCIAGYLPEEGIDSDFGTQTQAALQAFCVDNGFDPALGLTDKVWAALVDASFDLGDRSLYLKMPYFHGADVRVLQEALGALGFVCGPADGIFGAHTELALRKFQLNLGLPQDGIAGSQTYMALRNLRHNWEGKGIARNPEYLGFARVSDVLERHALCLYGTQPFTRDVASRMSNLALATNASSKIVSAEDLLVNPDTDMFMVHIVLPQEPSQSSTPRVALEDGDGFVARVESAITTVRHRKTRRINIELPGDVWMDAGKERSAQHYAITLIDGLCSALADLEQG